MKKYLIKLTIILTVFAIGIIIGCKIADNIATKQINETSNSIDNIMLKYKQKLKNNSSLKDTLKEKKNELTKPKEYLSSLPIDVEERKCLQKAKNNTEKNNCKYIAGDKWKNKADDYLKKIEKVITDREIKKLRPDYLENDEDDPDELWLKIRAESTYGIKDIKESQNTWQQRINADFELINYLKEHKNNKKIINFAADNYKDTYKNRAMFLKEIYEVYTGTYWKDEDEE